MTAAWAFSPKSRSTATKSTGTSTTPRMVATSMPANTAIPMTLRPSAPAPEARTSGKTPRMNAKAVMRMGRSRSFAASIAASMKPRPFFFWASLANSTMRMAFFAASPTSMMSPICAKMLLT